MDLSKASDKRGFGFEYDVSAMFQSQGYLTRRGVPLHYGSSNQDATDIDVFGVLFTNPFQGHRVICDCKNKARTKPYERIFWAKGLGDFVNASNVFVALNRTQWDIIRFANDGGVKVLTTDVLNQYKGGYNAYGLADATYYEPYEREIQKVAKSNSLLSRVNSSAKRLYLSNNPYLSMNIALEYLSIVAKQLQVADRFNSEELGALRYFACELTVIVGLQILWICSDVLGLPEKGRREYITSKLTFGDLDPKTARNIINSAKDLAREMIQESVPSNLVPRVLDFGEIPSPDYTDSLIGLVERALSRPEWYLNMPQLLDYLLFEQGLKGKDSDENVRALFGFGVEDQRMKAARNIISFVRNSTGIDWRIVWKKNVPSSSVADGTEEVARPSKMVTSNVPEEATSDSRPNHAEGSRIEQMHLKFDDQDVGGEDSNG